MADLVQQSHRPCRYLSQRVQPHSREQESSLISLPSEFVGGSSEESDIYGRYYRPRDYFAFSTVSLEDTGESCLVDHHASRCESRFTRRQLPAHRKLTLVPNRGCRRVSYPCKFICLKSLCNKANGCYQLLNFCCTLSDGILQFDARNLRIRSSSSALTSSGMVAYPLGVISDTNSSTLRSSLYLSLITSAATKHQCWATRVVPVTFAIFLQIITPAAFN